MPPFALPSSLSAPVSPLSSHSFLSRIHPSEGRDRSSLSPSLTFNNNNNNNSLAPAAQRSCISSSPRPVVKSRHLSSSLSFNRGTAVKPAVHNNGSSVMRASSFQGRANPSASSLLRGPGSDNDSLHSSTSSLEYSGGVSKATLCPSVSPQEEFYLPQVPQQAPQQNENFGHQLHLKEFSSYGNVFHSAMDQGPGIRLAPPGPRGGNHCSMPSLDLQLHDGGRGRDQMFPGLGHGNANWNGRHVNAASFGEDGYGGIRNDLQQKLPHTPKAPQLKVKVKETQRLNKFPLDLEALVSGTSATKVQEGSLSPHQPAPPPRSGGDPLHRRLESSSDVLASSFQRSTVSVSPRSPTPSQDAVPGPPSCSPSTHHRPQTEVPPGHREEPTRPSSSVHPLGDTEGGAGDSIGSILQRIASFALHAPRVDAPVQARYQPAQSDAGSSSPPDIQPRWRQEVKNQKGMGFSFSLQSLCMIYKQHRWHRTSKKQSVSGPQAAGGIPSRQYKNPEEDFRSFSVHSAYFSFVLMFPSRDGAAFQKLDSCLGGFSLSIAAVVSFKLVGLIQKTTSGECSCKDESKLGDAISYHV